METNVAVVLSSLLLLAFVIDPSLRHQSIKSGKRPDKDRIGGNFRT